MNWLFLYFQSPRTTVCVIDLYDHSNKTFISKFFPVGIDKFCLYDANLSRR